MGWKAPARAALEVIAGNLGITPRHGPPYDVHLYEALRDLRPWSPQDIVFDIGANDGRTILRLQRHLPSPRIFAFEPVSTTFRTLTDRTAHLANVQCYQLGLGAESGRRDIYLNQSAALNSLYPEWGASDRTEAIEMTTVDRFVAQQDLPHVHLLKIDVEGHDLEVLSGAEQTLRDARVSIIEVEAGFSAPGKKQPSLHELQTYLREFNYYLYGIYNQCRGRPLSPDRIRSDGEHSPPEILVYCDAVFVCARAGEGRI